ncbi:MAG: CrcB family protein [Aquincola tertiaricarbonis]|uniref:CrcB family protein n=1 Tax=Aquincola TaxID=391952 RepID=UPI0006150644|nr:MULTISPECIES: CrcB family protein [Aquincola]MCR5864859.1 CrcB family protein [Aquincola sp. J276]
MTAALGAVPWTTVAAIGIGAAAGALARFAAGLWFNGLWRGFPLGTLLVNCVGGFLVGAAMVLFARHPDETLRHLAVTGFLGGLTTFSAFSGESLGLLQRGELPMAAAHTLSHVLGALLCASLGFLLARAALRP